MDFSSKKLIILDRDGVINYDSDEYIKSPDEWRPLPGSLEAIKQLNDAGKIVVVATNQAGPARGLFTMEALTQTHQKFFNSLTAIGAHVDALEFCPHHPDDHCACRKPQPGMLLALLKKFAIAPEHAMMIGDSYRDLEAADAAGMDSVLVRTGKGMRTLEKHILDVPVFDDLSMAVQAILDEYE
jgi:D-glycero-D-manno-heptose 1,7-bisphosphate phosphatase